MARKISFVPLAATSITGNRVDIADIPEDIKADVEESYKTLKTNLGRLRAEFDTKAEMLNFARLAAAYCDQRPTELGGPLRFRKSPTRGLPENVMDYRITDPRTEAEKTTEEIRDATAVANGTPVKAAKAAKATAGSVRTHRGHRSTEVVE